MATVQYKGMRYVPIFGRKNENSIEWDNSKPYESLTIVTHNGASYTSRREVPAGIDIDDQEYWALTSNYNAQVEIYRQKTAEVYGQFTTIRTELDEKPFVFDTVADMCACTYLSENSACQTLGYYQKGDGGNALYLVVDNATPNNIDIFNTASDGIVVKLVADSIKNVRQYGIMDNVSDFTERFEYLVSTINRATTIYFPAGRYFPNRQLVVNKSNVTIKGDGIYGTEISAQFMSGDGSACLLLGDTTFDTGHTVHDIELKDVYIIGRTGNRNGVEVMMYYDCFVHDCILFGYGANEDASKTGGLVVRFCQTMRVSNVFFPSSGGCGVVTLTTESVGYAVQGVMIINDCEFMELHCGVSLWGGGTVIVNSCSFGTSLLQGHIWAHVGNGYPVQSRLTISNCNFGDSRNNPSVHIGGMAGSTPLVIKNNVWNYCPVAIHISSTVAGNNVIIADNVFDYCGSTEAQDVSNYSDDPLSNTFKIPIIIGNSNGGPNQKFVTGNMFYRTRNSSPDFAVLKGVAYSISTLTIRNNLFTNSFIAGETTYSKETEILRGVVKELFGA